MQENFYNIGVFAVFVVLGIIVNLLKKRAKKEKITTWRIVEEVFGAVWISILAGVILDEFTQIGNLAIYAISSFCGFANSFVIDKIGKGALQSVADKLKTKPKNEQGDI